MSEWELLDVMNNHMNMALVSFSNYLTLVFGFLAASYLVAHRLKKIEIYIITGLFAFGALIQAYSTVTHITRQYMFAEIAKQRLPEMVWFHSKTLIVITLVVTLLGIIASIYFMFNRAKQAEKQ